MRVRKKCPECQKLKSMFDFGIDTNKADGRTNKCSSCISENKYKIENEPLKLNIMSLKEKREAAALEAAKVVATPTSEKVAPVEKKTVKKTVKKEVVVVVAAEVPETETVGEIVEAVVEAIEEMVPPTPESEPAVVTPKVEKVAVVKVEKVIEQLDATGEKVIKKYKTLQEAADAVGATKAYLMDGLKGWSKTVKGFRWRYEGEGFVVREKKVKE